MNSQSILQSARKFLNLEAQALTDTAEALDEKFCKSIGMIADVLKTQKKLIFAGLGKNAGISHKLAGTFNSTGMSSVVLDPVQAVHGDLGICKDGDLAFLISNSGETTEVVNLVPLLKRLGVKTIAITGKSVSSLSDSCDQVLTYLAKEEACPLKLAPTSSTTATLALGDALAMVFLEMREFSREDFAVFHPSGTLGASLLLKVEDIMRTDERLASIDNSKTVQDAIVAMTKAKAGSIVILNKERKLDGIFTDADLRRAILDKPDVFSDPISSHMTTNPIRIESGTLAADALKIFEENNIDDLPVVDTENRPTGMIDGQDLPKLRIV